MQWANVVFSALGNRLGQDEQTDLIVLMSSGLGLPALSTKRGRNRLLVSMGFRSATIN